MRFVDVNGRFDEEAAPIPLAEATFLAGDKFPILFPTTNDAATMCRLICRRLVRRGTIQIPSTQFVSAAHSTLLTVAKRRCVAAFLSPPSSKFQFRQP